MQRRRRQHARGAALHPCSLLPHTPPREQHDDELLRGMLSKEKAKSGGDEASLRAILGKYDISDADIAQVMAWKQRQS